MEEQRKKILIVDDSEMNREILVSMLEDEFDVIQGEDRTDSRRFLLCQNTIWNYPCCYWILRCL